MTEQIDHLPPPIFRRTPHVFGHPIWMPLNRQTERTCAICGAVKVTVHGENGFAWRAWRAKGSSEQGPLHIACAAELRKTRHEGGLFHSAIVSRRRPFVAQRAHIHPRLSPF
jgi:hypothetical protein